MTLAISGPIGIGTGVTNRDLALEFGLSSSASFPSAYYGKGGAPTSGPLALSDFYGRSNASAYAASYNIGGVTSSPIGSTGRTRYRRNLTANITGGTGPFTYAWEILSNTGAVEGTVGPTESPVIAEASWANDGSEGVGSVMSIRLTVTDSGNGNATAQSTQTVTL